MSQAFAFAALIALPVLHSFTTNLPQKVINSFMVELRNRK